MRKIATYKKCEAPVYTVCRYTGWSCQNVCDALSCLLVIYIYISIGTKLHRQIVGITMGTNCVPLVTDLFSYCYERDLMDSLTHKIKR